MNAKDVKVIAAKQGVRAGKMKKGEIIRAIQHAEGNPACFETGKAGSCGEKTCIWKEDCS